MLTSAGVAVAVAGAWAVGQGRSEPAPSPRIATIIARPGETLQAALARAGGAAQDARAAGAAFEAGGKPGAGVPIRVALTDRSREPGRLLALAIDMGLGRTVSLAPDYGGAFEVRPDVGGGPIDRSDRDDASEPPRLTEPVPGARVSSAFGMRAHPILGIVRMHEGIDLAAPAGTAVRAAGDGVITEAGPRGTYGNWLRIRHAGDLETGYGHLRAFAPGIGQGVRVRQGEVIGFVGRTGLTTGPHLHFEVWRDGAPVDPQPLAFGRSASALGLRASRL